MSGKKAALGGGIAAAIIIGVVTVAHLSLPTASLVPSGSPNNTKLKVTASFFPIYEFAKNIGGDRAYVSVLVPVGAEPHGWEPTTQQMVQVQDSRLFIYNGAGLESFIPSLLAGESLQNTTFVRASDGIPMQRADVLNAGNGAKPVIEQGGMDPHVWNDPVLAEREVRNIANAMEKSDKPNAEYYEANAQSYMAKLAKLDGDIRSGLSDCHTRTFLSFHNAFSYFSQRYNLTDYWISGIAPESEISPQDLARIEDIASQNHAKVIFTEDLVDPKLAETLAADVNATAKILSPLEGINQTEQNHGITFIDKWYQNLDALKYAMGCQ